MKKFLVLSLVLVMALAGSAMAAVEIGGEFGAKVEQNVLTWGEDDGFADGETDEFGILKGDFGFSQNLKLNLKGSSDTWSLNVNLANFTSFAKDDFPTSLLDGNAGYTLKVNDDLFNLIVWQGNTNNQGFVQDPFALVQGRRLGAATIRATAPIMDVAEVKLQLEPKSSVLAFVTADVAGAEVGLAAQRKFKEDEDENFFAEDTVVAHAAYDFEVAKATIGGGISMLNGEEVDKLEDRLAFAAKVEVPVTEEISAEASYVVKQNDWKGNGKNSAVATLKGSYETDELEVNASFETAGRPTNATGEDNRTTTFGLDGTYNFTDDMNVKLGAEYKIDKDKKDLQAKENINTTKLTASVAAPIVEGLVSAKANIGYTFDNLGAIRVGTYLYNSAGFGKTGATLRNNSSFALAKSLFEAGASVEVTPIEKLTLTPAIEFKSFKDGNDVVAEAKAIRELRDANFHGDYLTTDFTAGSILVLKADATYAIGGGATLTLSAGNNSYNFTEINGDDDLVLKYNNPFASVAVKVVF